MNWEHGVGLRLFFFGQRGGTDGRTKGPRPAPPRAAIPIYAPTTAAAPAHLKLVLAAAALHENAEAALLLLLYFRLPVGGPWRRIGGRGLGRGSVARGRRGAGRCGGGVWHCQPLIREVWWGQADGRARTGREDGTNL